MGGSALWAGTNPEETKLIIQYIDSKFSFSEEEDGNLSKTLKIRNIPKKIYKEQDDCKKRNKSDKNKR